MFSLSSSIEIFWMIQNYNFVSPKILICVTFYFDVFVTGNFQLKKYYLSNFLLLYIIKYRLILILKTGQWMPNITLEVFMYVEMPKNETIPF